jgi:hypothetical protein
LEKGKSEIETVKKGKSEAGNREQGTGNKEQLSQHGTD